MNKKLTRKEFLLFIGSLVGLFVLSRIPGSKLASSKTASVSTNGYGSGSYGGKRSA